MESVLFFIILSLLLIHEMDAIRAREWEMFIVLKDMPEETAFSVFTAIHFPLYFIVLFILFCGGTTAITAVKIIIDVFIVGHTILHYGFRKHKDNGFRTVFSKAVIYSMPVLAMLHVLWLFVL